MARKSKPQTKKQKRLTIEVLRQMLTLATSGFGLVMALAWNSLIQEIVNDYIKKYFASNSSLISLFLYALVVTILAVIVTFQLSKILDHLEN
ncbi:MAG TPA: DUF5654 family protein [Patescibacteria group bacterium]